MFISLSDEHVRQAAIIILITMMYPDHNDGGLHHRLKDIPKITNQITDRV